MTRYADPASCPDCGTALDGALICPGCGLDLRGDLGQQLFTTLTAADSLLEQMRARSRPDTAPGAPPQPMPYGMPAPVASPVSPVAVRPSAVRPSAVPKILLTVGAACILVAAVVFLAVTWSVLGVGGRTAVLVALTAAVGGLTWWSTRQGFRGAVEALGLVTLGLVTLDLIGARASGWFGDTSASGFVVAASVVMAVLGLLGAHVCRRTSAGGFTLGEVTAAVAGLSALVGMLYWDAGLLVVRLIALVLGLAATVLVARRAGLRVGMVGLGLVTVLGWVTLFGAALDHGYDDRDGFAVGHLWGDLAVWPLLVTAALVLPLTLRRAGSPLGARAAANLAVGTVVVAVSVAGLDEAGTPGVLSLVAAVLALAVLSAALLPRTPAPWPAAALLALGTGAGVLAVESMLWVATAIGGYARTATAGWDGTPGGPVRTLSDADAGQLTSEVGAAWLLPVTVATLGLAVWAAARLTERGRALDVRLVGVVLGSATTLAAAATTLNYPLPVWVLLAGALVVAGVATVFGLDDEHSGLIVVSAVFLVLAQPLSWYDEVLSLGCLSVTLLLLGVSHGLARDPRIASAAGLLVGPALGGWAFSLAVVLDLAQTWATLAGLLALAALVLTRWLLPGQKRAVTAVEVGCAVAGLVLLAVGAAVADDGTWFSVYLTVTGAAASALALLREDRRQVGWAGGLLLAAATWFRLADLGVKEPEAYTLPSAIALIGVGLYQLRKRPGLSTASALSAGLGLALVPSLLWVLADPVGWRALLLGLAALALVLAGTQVRWAAPLLWGAAVGLVVVLREAGPFVGAGVLRWGVLGAAGAVLVLVALTWERRLAEAQRALRYVRDLR